MAEDVLQWMSYSPADTQHLAEKVASILGGGEIIYLLGDLGAGKSLFARGILRALGHEGPVMSPTFVLQQEYILESLKVLHLDLYRLDLPQDLLELGLEEFDGWVLLVEWADRFPEDLPPPHLTVRLDYRGEERRMITLKGEKNTLRRLSHDTGN